MVLAFLAELANTATAVAVFVAAGALLLGRSHARTAFEDDISRQYREIVKPALTTRALLNVGTEEAEALSPFYQYVDLCNEQVFLRLTGRLRRRTWIQWSAGMKSNLHAGPFETAWERIKEATEDFAELRLLEASGYVDPRKWFRVHERIFAVVVGRELSIDRARERLVGPSQPGSRDLDATALRLHEDWIGNNAAFCCGACGKVFVVSAVLHRNGRGCPRCGRAVGFVEGGSNSGGRAWIE